MKKTIIGPLSIFCVCCCLLWGSAGYVFAAPVVTWDFTSDTSGWQHAAGVALQLSSSSYQSSSAPSLRATGTTGGGSVFQSPYPGVSLQPGATLQVTAFMKMDECVGNTSLKLYFMGSNKSIYSNSYDSIRYGTWQKLVISTYVPEATTTAYVVVLQGNSGPVDISVDDVVFEYVDQVDPLAPLDGTVPAALLPYSGKHPRVYLSTQTVTALKGGITSAPYQAIWQRIKANADASITSIPGTFPSATIEQRTLGFYLPRLCFAWLISGEQKYFDAATAIATQMAQAASWGAVPDSDHVAGVVLFGLSIYYDWCYDSIPAGLRTTIRDRIKTAASTMSGRLLNGSSGDPWWKNAYLCNQMPVALAGLAAAGYATFDENSGGAAWIQLSVNKIENLLSVRSDDGTYTEGVGYWGYDMEHLLKMLHLFRQMSGENLFGNAWLENTAIYRLYMGLPRNSWTRANQVVDFDDAVRVNWYGPDTILRCLAKEYNNHQAQWLVEELSSSNYTNETAEWLNMIWMSNDVSPVPPAAMPTFKHFPDIGLVSARSGWSGDESLLVYTAGPQIGQKAFTVSTTGRLYAEHMHRDAGHFIIFANGEWQLRDDSYWDDSGAENPRKTENHNTLVIDGMDQRSADEVFAARATPCIVGSSAGSEADVIKSDLREAYKPELGLSKYDRYVIFMKPDILIVIDDIALGSAHDMELLFHTENLISRPGECFIANGTKSSMRIGYLAQEGITAAFDNNRKYSNSKLTMHTVSLKKTSNAWRNATVFSWSGATPPEVTIQDTGGAWVFSSGGRQYTFQWDPPPSAPKGLTVK